MTSEIQAVTTAAELDEVFSESFTRPVLLFKHSDTCGISMDVLERVSAVIEDIRLVVVQDDRDISNAIAQRLGIRHASPQAFVLWQGKPVYHATHYGIDPAAIAEKLATR
ncbi:MAG: bacillithiol system redox-active protein YtxJ [Acidobacteriota bacterium]